MRKPYLTSVAAIALALGAMAAGAQNADQRRNTGEGPPSEAQPGGQNQNAQAPQQNPPNPTGQNARQQSDAPPTQGPNQQQGAQPPPQQGAQAPQNRETEQDAEAKQAHKSGLIALDEQKQMRISDIIRRQRIQPVTNLNFSLSVASTVPSSVRLSRISGELADIFPDYRDFSFFVARQELVIVDPQSHAMIGFVPISSGSTVGTAPPRENTGAVGTAEPPAPAKKRAARTERTRENTEAVDTAEPPALGKKNAARTERKRVTVTEEAPKALERGTARRRPADTETDVTVGASRRDSEEVYEVPPRDRGMAPPVRERHERDQGPPFPFSLLFGRWF